MQAAIRIGDFPHGFDQVVLLIGGARGVDQVGKLIERGGIALLCQSQLLEFVQFLRGQFEFAFQNEDDWIRNRVTARCECFETLNFRRPESILYLDMGNS